MKVIVVATVTPPEGEDCKERWRTLNYPARIPVELHSWNQNRETHLLQLEKSGIWRVGDRGRDQQRPIGMRRYSRSHLNRKDNRFQLVHRDGVRFNPNLEKKFLTSLKDFVRISVERR